MILYLSSLLFNLFIYKKKGNFFRLNYDLDKQKWMRIMACVIFF